MFGPVPLAICLAGSALGIWFGNFNYQTVFAAATVDWVGMAGVIAGVGGVIGVFTTLIVKSGDVAISLLKIWLDKRLDQLKAENEAIKEQAEIDARRASEEIAALRASIQKNKSDIALGKSETTGLRNTVEAMKSITPDPEAPPIKVQIIRPDGGKP